MDTKNGHSQIDCSSCGRNEIVDYLKRSLTEYFVSAFQSGEQLPSVRPLARELKIAPQTLYKVYKNLEISGVVRRASGGRLWYLNESAGGRNSIAVILPVNFSCYFQPKTETGQLRFRIYSGIMDEAEKHGVNITTCYLPPVSASAENIEKSIKKIVNGNFGVIHFGGRVYRDDIPLGDLLKCRSVTHVSINSYFPYEHVIPLTYDFQGAVSSFLSFAMELGHRRFAYVKTNEDENAYFTRYHIISSKEIRNAFESNGVAPENLVIIKCWNGMEKTLRNEFMKLLKEPDPPRIFWCRNDMVAMEMIEVIKESGCKVPDDFSVVGFNDSLLSTQSALPLTTFHNPLYELGRMAVQVIMSGKSGKEVQHGGIIPRLIVRDSTGPYNEK